MASRLLFLVYSSSYFLSHRLGIAIEAKKQGYEVHIASPEDGCEDTFKIKGLMHHKLPISRTSINIFSEIKAFLNIYFLIKKINPDLLHLITIKPVIYGGIISRLIQIKGVVSAVPGLGYVYISKGIRAAILRFFINYFYKVSFSKKSLKIIFQNKDDMNKLRLAVGFDPIKSVIIKGSGVDLDEFKSTPLPEGRPVISMISRLQEDKGVKEFARAAQMIKERKIEADFWLIGDTDSSYPSPILIEDLQEWENKGFLSVLGYRKDINILIGNSNIIVLPSYREGLPKVLLEAAACGRPVITTDVPGCRAAIEEGKTGLLVPPRDSSSLADKIEYLLGNKELLKKMGNAGRKLAEENFSLDKVVSAHLKIYSSLIDKEQ